MVTPEEIDDAFVPVPSPTVVPVPIGDELVLVEGWDQATVLSPSAALIWARFDGVASLGQIVAEVATAHSVAPDIVRPDAVGIARQLGAVGILQGVTASPPPDGEPGLELQVIPDVEVGDQIADLALPDLQGVERSIFGVAGHDTLLVNWSPHCGYCAVIATRLAVLHPLLEEAGVDLVLVATGDASANRRAAEAAGLHAPILLVEGAPNPFIHYGTPGAYHVDADRRVAAIAFGSVEVPALAAELAGSSEVDAPGGDGDIRYLLADAGLCAPLAGLPAPEVTWAGVRTYRIGAFHVGIRFDAEPTATTLDRLFGDAVHDPRAGHSYSVSLAAADDEAAIDAGVRRLNLLSTGGQTLVRSRSAERILRALLWRLADDIAGLDAKEGRIRVRATAVRVGGAALLLQPGLEVLADGLQPRFARAGIALVDVPFPEIDLTTAELVVPEPAIDHDRGALAAIGEAEDLGSELPPVLPGRYPLLGWGFIHPGEHAVAPMSPAAAAAATLSFVLDSEDVPARLVQLGQLFERIDGFGLWYHSESELTDAIVEALAGIGR